MKVKTLLIHVEKIKVIAILPAKGAKGIVENIKEREIEDKDTLLTFIAVEKDDKKVNIDKFAEQIAKNLLNTLEKIGLKKVFLYPFVHLTQNPEDPKLSFELIKKIEEKLKKYNIEVKRAPFGWYKKFEITSKSHPLAELSRIIEYKEEEKKEKDHMDFGDELDLIVNRERLHVKLKKPFGDLIGSGIQLFSIGGGLYRKILFDILTDYHIKKGYYRVETPILTSINLYKISGHYDHYKENMYIFKIEDHEFAIKPMNCPLHILILSNLLEKTRKIKLPFRIFELGLVHRYEYSGSLYGLLRVRAFTQDDAHIFVREKNIEDEMINVFDQLLEIYEKLFYLERNKIKIRLSFYDEKLLGKEFAGSKEEWELVQDKLEKIGEKIKRKYNINYFIQQGEAAFYGPKIDVVVDFENLGEWQIGTIQFDFNLPKRFKLDELFEEYLGVNDIYMIHRALLGSIERFTGIFLEYTKGRLPFVLNPIQVAIIKIKTGKEIDDKIDEYSKNLFENLKKEEIRVVEIESGKTMLNSTIKKLESSIKPSVYIFVGEKEVANNKLSIKYYDLKEKKHKYGSDLWSVIENLEKDVMELNSKKYRVYEDFSILI